MKKKNGFGLLEIIIAMAIAAILGTVGITVYNDQIVRSNQESTKHDIVSLMGDFGKFYTHKGSYATRDGSLPDGVKNQVIAWNNNNNKLYKIDVYVKPSSANMPKVGSSNTGYYSMESNTQTVCIVAKPMDNTIMSGTGTIIVDEFGHTTVGGNDTASSLCGNAIPNPYPDPTNDVNPKPTQTPDDKTSCDTITTFDDAKANAEVCCKKSNAFLAKWGGAPNNLCGGGSGEYDCGGLPVWSSSQAYEKSITVTWENKVYTSNQYTQGRNPAVGNTSTAIGEPWDITGSCRNAPTPTPSPSPEISPEPIVPSPEPVVPSPTPNECDNLPIWSATATYDKAGIKVTYNNNKYISSYWTKGNNPETNSGADGSGKPWVNLGACEGVTPTPTPTVSPKPSTTPVPSPSPSVSPKPTPSPTPTREPDFPTPVPHECNSIPDVDTASVAWASLPDHGCHLWGEHGGDGNCDSKAILSQCNGNCNDTVNFVPYGTNFAGCNGNCTRSITVNSPRNKIVAVNGNGKNATICNGWVNGAMHNAMIVGGPLSGSLLCNGGCQGSTIIVNPKSPEGLVCNGNCHNLTIYIPKSWEDGRKDKITLSNVCSGSCSGTVITY